jgi:hypothetical protein
MVRLQLLYLQSTLVQTSPRWWKTNIHYCPRNEDPRVPLFHSRGIHRNPRVKHLRTLEKTPWGNPLGISGSVLSSGLRISATPVLAANSAQATATIFFFFRGVVAVFSCFSPMLSVDDYGKSLLR